MNFSKLCRNVILISNILCSDISAMKNILKKISKIKFNINKSNTLPEFIDGSEEQLTYKTKLIKRNFDKLQAIFMVGIELSHESEVHAVAFSPNGRSILVGGKSKTARLWDLTRTPLNYTLLEGHTDWINSVAFNSEGTYAVTGSSDGTARVWDLSNLTEGSPLSHVLQDGNNIKSVSFAYGGNYVFTRSINFMTNSMSTKQWNLAEVPLEPVVITANLSTYQGTKFDLAPLFSNDGKYMLCQEDKNGREKKLIGLVETEENSKQIRLNQNGNVISVAVSSNKMYALTTTLLRYKIFFSKEVYVARLWDLSRPNKAPMILDHYEPIAAVAFSPDGRYALTGSWDNLAKLWDISLLTQEVNLPSIIVHPDWVNSVVFSPDGKYIVTGSRDKFVRIWLTDLSYLTIEQIFFAIKLFKLKAKNKSYEQLFQEDKFKEAIQDSVYKLFIEQYLNVTL